LIRGKKRKEKEDTPLLLLLLLLLPFYHELTPSIPFSFPLLSFSISDTLICHGPPRQVGDRLEFVVDEDLWSHHKKPKGVDSIRSTRDDP